MPAGAQFLRVGLVGVQTGAGNHFGPYPQIHGTSSALGKCFGLVVPEWAAGCESLAVCCQHRGAAPATVPRRVS